MDKAPKITLESEFTYNEVKSLYKIKFFGSYLSLEANDFLQTIEYDEISNIRCNSKLLKIYFKTLKDIKIPCQEVELRRIKTFFKSKVDTSPINVNASGLVTFGKCFFFICIDTTDFKETQKRVIKYVARYFYPACDPDEVSMDLSRKLVFKVVLDELEIPIKSNEDLEAALRYNNYKIRIKIYAAN